MVKVDKIGRIKRTTKRPATGRLVSEIFIAGETWELRCKKNLRGEDKYARGLIAWRNRQIWINDCLPKEDRHSVIARAVCAAWMLKLRHAARRHHRARMN